jgi:hypothetical protein
LDGNNSFSLVCQAFRAENKKEIDGIVLFGDGGDGIASTTMANAMNQNP